MYIHPNICMDILQTSTFNIHACHVYIHVCYVRIGSTSYFHVFSGFKIDDLRVRLERQISGFDLVRVVAAPVVELLPLVVRHLVQKLLQLVLK